MIIEAILGVFLLIPKAILSLLPEIDVRIPDNVFGGLDNILSGIGYVLPIKGLLPILVISLAMSLFKIPMAILVRVKSFIPTMGD